MGVLHQPKSIFAPTSHICINEYSSGVMKGFLWAPDYDAPKPFSEVVELLDIMEDSLNGFKFPQASVTVRTFPQDNNKSLSEKMDSAKKSVQETNILRNAQIEDSRGAKGTFAVNIKYRQNASWQGSVHWLEKDKTISFRSALELIKLLDSAMEENEKE